MARVVFSLGLWTLTITIGILGYQALTWYFYQGWPAVSVGAGWQEVRSSWHEVFGDPWMIPDRYRWSIPDGSFRDALHWISLQPLVLAGMLLSFVFFLMSDALRGRWGRRG